MGIPFKDKQVGLIVETGTIQSQKSPSILYRTSAEFFPRSGGWSLDGGEGA